MLEMFETGDLEGALRHAIPLSADVAAGLSPPALLTPRPRTDLSIVPHRARATSSLGLADDLFSVLGRTYRRAFERLVAQGDIEKAAFVLAELLQASEEAVSFLERHGKWTLAAEIAEARELAPGLVIRQWFLAGERDRAVQIARRSGAFADAIQRLEGTHKEHARALRLLWASSLAEAGAFPAAIDAVWPVEAARGLAAAWLDRAIAVGGETGARMRVRKLRLLPGSFGEVRDEVRALLADDGDDGRRLALATANELLQGETSAGVRRVAGVVARALLGDVGDGEAARLGRRLLDVAGDGVLRADVLACRPEQAKAAPEAPPVSVQAFAVTHMGNVRTLNEDDVLATSLNDDFAASKRRAIEGEVSRGGVLLGVFDGVGGASSGEFASELVKKTVFDAMRGAFVTRGSDVSAWAATLREAVVAGGRELWREGVTNPARRGAGCTATVATVCGSTLLLAQVGDTRGYVLREKKLVQVTVDHTLVNQLLAEGKLSLEESASYEHQNVVTRALGVSEDVEVDLTGVALRRGDVVVLCSDGLSRMVGDAAIREALLGRAPHHACEALQSLALAAGGYDNLSIVVAEVGWGGLALPSAADPVLAVPIEGATLDDAPVDAVPLRARASAHRVRRVAADVGALRVWDAVELPDGRLLVALGELGARLLARDGRVLARFAQPTQHIVFSDHGDRAILVARRGEALRLARLDLLSKRVRPWCDARVSAFAPDFDGSCWYVGHENRVFAIAATAEGWGHDWTLEHAPVGGIARDPKELSVRFSSDGASAEVWTFESASRTLRSRRSYDGLTGPVATSAGGALVAWRDMRAVEEKGSGPAFWLGDRVRPFGTEGGALAGAGRPVITAEWIAFSAGVDGAEAGQRVLFFDTSALRERLVVVLEGATAAAVRVQGDRAVLCDDRGRVLVLSLRDGSVAREIRVS
jgi:serine/threonine protein phosphatase PrpC